MSFTLLRKRLLDLLGPDSIRADEPMSSHTTFRVGGPADLWVRPTGADATVLCAEVLRAAKSEAVPVFILGGGANLVVADAGIRGLVLDMTGCTSIFFEHSGVEPDAGDDGGPILVVGAGLSVDAAVDACVDRSLSGLEFLSGMPGTIGGAVWMNARCYGRSISDALLETVILDERLELVAVPLRSEDFDYKISPFQKRNVLILSARFRLERKNGEEIRAVAASHRADRDAKGHFRLPSAGSSFKNDYAYGKPTGRIVDELGLRGLRVGGAVVAPWHGNIIVNEGSATAADIRSLTDEVASRVKTAIGLSLEPEILFVGDW
ncbi:MAG: UDP-N-acetylmuramate dehydrogenase [Treponemataceae bacterium]